MRLSEMFLPTLREIPTEAETVSHKLMLRAGLVRRIASGIYSYLPLGYRVIRKIELEKLRRLSVKKWTATAAKSSCCRL